MKTNLTTLKSVKPLKASYYLLTFDAPDIAKTALPGQFVHVKVPAMHEARMRRPFSIYGVNRDKNELMIMYKVVGKGTRFMEQMAPGMQVDILGPIGRPFPTDAIEGTPYLVGGGYGVAPLYFLATQLPKKGILFVGGRTADDILEIERFQELGWEVRVTTQDGSLGETGLVTLPLDAALAKDNKATLFSCGPDGLLHAVGDRAIAHNIKGWLSLDKHMICAVGACLACVQNLIKADGSPWVGRVCVDGPIFEAREIQW